MSQLPIILYSDIHGNLPRVKELRAKYPNNLLKCLGDIVDMANYDGNQETVDYFMQNELYSLRGNHDRVIANKFATTFESVCWLRSLPRSFEIKLDNLTLIGHHTIPDFDDTFVYPNISEAEFIKYYNPPLNSIICIGHNHVQWLKSFPAQQAQLVSVGALSKGHYVELHLNPVTIKFMSL